jgi:UDP-N-acetyl-D-glucosamine dehydrogenase
MSSVVDKTIATNQTQTAQTQGPSPFAPTTPQAGDNPRRLLSEAIANRTATVAVIGLGYVGLPLIRAFSDAGFPTLGYDVDEAKVNSLNNGNSYIGHISSEWLQTCLANARFCATSHANRLVEADAILICVPTPLSESRDPDLSYVVSTVRTISAYLRSGQLIILESTTYPGTTRDIVLPELAKSGLQLGEDFFVAYSPEREDPGNRDYSTKCIPKVIGASDPTSQYLAESLYRSIVEKVVPVSSCEVAEACKILENTYRAVNIALVNELKVLFERMGIDVWEVIEAAKTKPFGYQAFYPGPGLGGHCIPIDPFYLSWLARKYGTSNKFIELAGEINSSMPEYVVRRLTEALNHRGKPVRASRVLILGTAYKRDVDDPRESPFFAIAERLIGLGAIVSYNDPHIPSLPKMRSHDLPPLESRRLTAEFIASQDCVLIVTDHTAYDFSFITENAQLIIDTRNATRNVAARQEKIVYA